MDLKECKWILLLVSQLQVVPCRQARALYACDALLAAPSSS